MKKTILRIIYGTAVFILTVIAMEVLFLGEGTSSTAGEMEPSVLPVVYMQAAGYTVNPLRGYKEQRDLSGFRAPVTPVDTDRTVRFTADLPEEDLKSLSYEIRSAGGDRLIEEQTISQLGRSDPRHVQGAFLVSDMLEEGAEYNLVLILETAARGKLYYYTRLLPIEGGASRRIDFAAQFHADTYDKRAGGAITTYIEPSGQGGEGSLSHVDIHNSYAQVTWGDFKPEEVSPVSIEITDIQKETASMTLRCVVKSELSDALFLCTERFLLREGQDRIYLIDYDRRTEQVFDPDAAVYENGSIRIGLADPSFSYVESEGGNAFAFVQAGGLYAGNISDRSVARVFRFAETDDSDGGNLNPEYGIRILSVDENGGVRFLVYGYMSRGVHEGECGISACVYNHAYRTIEEMAFIPYDKSYELLKVQVEKTSFWNYNNRLFLLLDDALYSVDLRKKRAEILVNGLDETSCEVSEDGNMIAYKAADNDHTLFLLDLSTVALRLIEAPENNHIFLLGFLRGDLLYGFSETEDTIADVLGGTIHPMHKLVIINRRLQILNEYEKEGIYVVSCDIHDGQALLKRVMRDEQTGSFVPVENDQIINTQPAETKRTAVTTAQEEGLQAVTYLSIHGFRTDGLKHVLARMTEKESDVRIDLPGSAQDDGRDDSVFYAYNTYGAIGCFHTVNNAVLAASSDRGVVVDTAGRYRYVFSNRPAKDQIMKIRSLSDRGETPLETCLYTILEYENEAADVHGLMAQGLDAADVLKEAMPDALVMDLSGCTLESVLYYITKEHPVLAMTGSGMEEAVLITGYNERQAVTADPADGTVALHNREELKEQLAAYGSRFLCYLRPDA